MNKALSDDAAALNIYTIEPVAKYARKSHAWCMQTKTYFRNANIFITPNDVPLVRNDGSFGH
jgi:hypothetical protein